MAQFPNLSFPMGLQENKKDGKIYKSYSGAFEGQNGEKYLVSFDPAQVGKYKSKKDGTLLTYARVTMLPADYNPRDSKSFEKKRGFHNY